MGEFPLNPLITEKKVFGVPRRIFFSLGVDDYEPFCRWEKGSISHYAGGRSSPESTNVEEKYFPKSIFLKRK